MTRGPVTFPAWREARPGTRVRRNGSGWTGTIVRVVVNHDGRSGHVTIEWDQSGATGRVVAPAYDLTPILKASDLQKDPQVRARNRAANRRNLPDECFVCGRGMTADAVERGTSIHLLTDGTIDPVRDLDAAMNDPRSQGWFPVGSECAKRVPPEVRW